MATTDNQKVSVLVIDDDPDLLATIEIQLHLRGYTVRCAGFAAEGIRIATSLQPDIVLLDIGLPDMGGIDAVRALRAGFKTACSGIIMVTAISDRAVMREAVVAGADDYIVKPYDIMELCCRIEMVKERAARNLERNPLTGLPGNNVIHSELARRIENRLPFALGYVDIDNFKAYNDRYGPERGDRMITVLGSALTDASAEVGDPSDFVGHIGGDDFIILTNPNAVDRLCDVLFKRFDEDIRELYATEDWENGGIEAEGRDGVRQFFPRATLSVGAAASLYSIIEKPQRAFELATQAKHHAKSVPGNHLEIWGLKPFDRDQAAAAAERLHKMDSWIPAPHEISRLA
jgi:diguanylate cyclase (GGDEF)-like protein